MSKINLSAIPNSPRDFARRITAPDFIPLLIKEGIKVTLDCENREQALKNPDVKVHMKRVAPGKGGLEYALAGGTTH